MQRALFPLKGLGLLEMMYNMGINGIKKDDNIVNIM